MQKAFLKGTLPMLAIGDLRFLFLRETGSFFDAIVSNPNEVWQLKIDSIYKPNPLIIGTRLMSIR